MDNTKLITHILFNHGKVSGAWGSKITKMVKHAKLVGNYKIHSIKEPLINRKNSGTHRFYAYRPDTYRFAANVKMFSINIFQGRFELL